MYWDGPTVDPIFLDGISRVTFKYLSNDLFHCIVTPVRSAWISTSDIFKLFCISFIFWMHVKENYKSVCACCTQMTYFYSKNWEGILPKYYDFLLNLFWLTIKVIIRNLWCYCQNTFSLDHLWVIGKSGQMDYEVFYVVFELVVYWYWVEFVEFTDPDHMPSN